MYIENSISVKTLRLFQRKTLCKDIFPYFSMLGSIKKYESNENYL